MTTGQQNHVPGQTADSRATTFQPVEGPSEHYSGEVLLVTGYALLWAILLFWVAMVWRKQGALDQRLRGLEKEIDRAAAANDAKP